jgi:hypothetical protein
MYDPGKGIFGDVSGSLHNIPMHMQDNGRVAQQIPTPGQVQIHNPAIHMSNTELQRGMRAMSMDVPLGGSAGMGHYQTKIHNAALYSTYAAEKRARETRDNIQDMRNLSGAAQIGLGLLGLTPIGAGVATVGSMALMAADYFMEDSEAYYKGFQNRMSDIRGIKSVMQGTGPAMMNRITGRASDSAALQYLSAMPGMASDIGITSGDLHGINTMAAQGGLLQGHGGSVGQLSQRLRQVAKLTKQIMDVGAGISAQDAMEMQRMAQEMDIDVSKFNTMEIGKRIITAAKISGRTTKDMLGVMASGGQISGQMGIGTAVGADIALFNDSFVNSSYSSLGIDARRKVGTADQFAATLNVAHSKFAASISSSLVGQSMFVDPTTGELRIDDGSAGLFQVGRKAALEANRRFRRTFTGASGNMLSSAGVSTSYIKSIMELQSADLAKSAAEGMDPEKRMELMLREAMVESQRLKIDPRAFLIRKYGKQAADAVMVQAKQFESAAASRSLDSYKQNLEYHATVAATDISGLGEGTASSSEKLGRIAASVEARLSERATEEAMGIFRRGGVTSKLGIMDVEVGGSLEGANIGTQRRDTLYNAYVGASNILDQVKEDGDYSLSARYRKSAQADSMDESLLGKYLISRGKEHGRFFDVGTMRGVQTDIMTSFNGDFADMSMSQISKVIGSTRTTDRELNRDLRAIVSQGGFFYGRDFTVAKLLKNSKISSRMRGALEQMDPDKVMTMGELASTRIGMDIVSGDISASNMYSQTRMNSSQIIRDAGLSVYELGRVNRAVQYFSSNQDSLRAEGTGVDQEVRASLGALGFSADEIESKGLERVFMSLTHTNSNRGAAKILSDRFTKTRGLKGPFSSEQVLEFNARDLATQLTGFGEEVADNSIEVSKRISQTALGGTLNFIFGGDSAMRDKAIQARQRRKGRTLASLLYDPGTDSTQINQEDAEERLLAFGDLMKASGGSETLLDVVRGLQTVGGGVDDAIDTMLAGKDITASHRKALRNLKGSKHLGALKRLMKVEGLQLSDLNNLGSRASGLKQKAALDNVIESLKNTGFSNILGDEAVKANKVIANLNSTKVAADSLQAYDKSQDVDRALAKFGLDTSEMGEKQKEQVRRLYMDTVGAEGVSGLGDFQKQLFKILDSAGKTSGGKTGGKTAEDPTLNTIRSFDKMLEASSMMMIALTKPKEEGAKDLKRAQSILQELAARAQVN